MSYFDIFKTGAMAFVTIGNCISSPLSVCTTFRQP